MKLLYDDEVYEKKASRVNRNQRNRDGMKERWTTNLPSLIIQRNVVLHDQQQNDKKFCMSPFSYDLYEVF